MSIDNPEAPAWDLRLWGRSEKVKGGVRVVYYPEDAVNCAYVIPNATVVVHPTSANFVEYLVADASRPFGYFGQDRAYIIGGRAGGVTVTAYLHGQEIYREDNVPVGWRLKRRIAAAARRVLSGKVYGELVPDLVVPSAEVSISGLLEPNTFEWLTALGALRDDDQAARQRFTDLNEAFRRHTVQLTAAISGAFGRLVGDELSPAERQSALAAFLTSTRLYAEAVEQHATGLRTLADREAEREV